MYLKRAWSFKRIYFICTSCYMECNCYYNNNLR